MNSKANDAIAARQSRPRPWSGNDATTCARTVYELISEHGTRRHRHEGRSGKWPSPWIRSTTTSATRRTCLLNRRHRRTDTSVAHGRPSVTQGRGRLFRAVKVLLILSSNPAPSFSAWRSMQGASAVCSPAPSCVLVRRSMRLTHAAQAFIACRMKRRSGQFDNSGAVRWQSQANPLESWWKCSFTQCSTTPTSTLQLPE